MMESVTTTIFFIVKLLVLIGLMVYILFAAILVRQEHLMANVLEERFEPVVRTITLVHLVAAVFVLAMAFFFLP